MQNVLPPQSVLLQSLAEFRPNIRGSMIVPFWERNRIRPGAISDDPLRVFGSCNEMIYCADIMQQSRPHPSTVLNPPIAPLKPNIFIEHCAHHDHFGEASFLGLREKWMPRHSYRHVTLGRGLDILLRGTIKRPETLEVKTTETGLGISLSQKEEVRFHPGRAEHTLGYQFEIRDPLKSLAVFGGMDQDVSRQVGPYVTIALALASHLYLEDPVLFPHGFGIVDPNHYYLLRFTRLRHHPGSIAIELSDNQGRHIPVTAESFPPSPNQWCLYNRYEGLGTLSMMLYWNEHMLRLEMSRQLDHVQSRGVRELENFFAGAFNAIYKDRYGLERLDPDQLDAVLTGQLANELIRTTTTLATEPAN